MLTDGTLSGTTLGSMGVSIVGFILAFVEYTTGNISSFMAAGLKWYLALAIIAAVIAVYSYFSDIRRF